MSIYLVQHGKSLSKEKDPEKGLSEEGKSEVKRIAAVAKGYNVRISVIEHSGKKRASQTAQIFADYLLPEKGIRKRQNINPMDDVVDLASAVNSEENVMYIGHLPFMEKLISYLITGNTNKTVFKLQNGGIVCLDYCSDEKSWMIKWALMPNVG